MMLMTMMLMVTMRVLFASTRKSNVPAGRTTTRLYLRIEYDYNNSSIKSSRFLLKNGPKCLTKKVNDANDDGRFVPRLEETLPPRRRALVFLRRQCCVLNNNNAPFSGVACASETTTTTTTKIETLTVESNSPKTMMTMMVRSFPRSKPWRLLSSRRRRKRRKERRRLRGRSNTRAVRQPAHRVVSAERR